jgi:hypothetical protein
MQPENWLQETGFDSRTGQIAVHMQRKTDRYVTITKHKKPESEKQDQVDIFDVQIDHAEAKTKQVELQGEREGTVKGTGTLEVEWTGGTGTSIIPGDIDNNLEEQGTTKTTVPEITISEPERKGKVKWKMIARETEDRGAWTRGEYFMQWSPGEGGQEGRGVPIWSSQAKGSIGWAYLMKCPEQVFWTRLTQQDVDYIQIEDRMELHETSWMRWALDKKIVLAGRNLTLKGRRLPIRNSEIPWVMIVMRSWGFRGTSSMWDWEWRINHKKWFTQIASHIIANWR